MFYSMDLLSERRRGKFAKCWLAATLGKLKFKKMYKDSKINPIMVVALCEELQKLIFVRNNKPSERTSLYMSAQLMYGVVVIHECQVDSLCKIMQAFRSHLFFPGILHGAGKEKRDNGPTLDQVIPDPAEISINYGNVHPNAEAITMLEIPPLLEIPPEGQLEFGRMDTSGLGFADMSLAGFERMPNIIEEPTVPQPPRESYGPDLGVEIPAPEPTFNEVSVPQVDVFDTPSKRKRAEPDIDTPSKRRRVTEKVDKGPRKQLVIEAEAVPVPAAITDRPAEETAAPITTLELEPLRDSLLDEPARKKKGLLIDEKKVLSKKSLNKMIDNVYFQTKQQQDPVQLPLPSDKELLTMPSYHAKNWGNHLMTYFEIPLVRPVGPRHPVRPQLRISGHGEFPEISAVRDVTTERSAELSSDIGKKTLVATGDSSDLIRTEDQMLVAQELHVDIPGQEPLVDIPEPLEPHIDISAQQEHHIDILEQQERHIDGSVQQEPHVGIPEQQEAHVGIPEQQEAHVGIPERQQREISIGQVVPEDGDVRPRVRSRYWSKMKLKLTLENLWQNDVTIIFRELCSLEPNTKLDAADCFRFCIELHKDRKAFVFQNEPYGDIMIRKWTIVS